MTDRRVSKYINAVKKRIVADYGSIPDEWSAQLQQLEDVYTVYLRASDTLKDSQLIEVTNGGRTTQKSLYFSIMTECCNTMKKIIADFGLSPLAKSKIKKPVTTDTDDFTENFLSD